MKYYQISVFQLMHCSVNNLIVLLTVRILICSIIVLFLHLKHLAQIVYLWQILLKVRLSVQLLDGTSMRKNIIVLPKMHCGGGNFIMNLPMVQYITTFIMFIIYSKERKTAVTHTHTTQK